MEASLLANDIEAFDHTAVINMQKVKKEINISGDLSLVSYPERGLVRWGERRRTLCKH